MWRSMEPSAHEGKAGMVQRCWGFRVTPEAKPRAVCGAHEKRDFPTKAHLWASIWRPYLLSKRRNPSLFDLSPLHN